MPTIKDCQLAMNNATTYTQWREAAQELDQLQGSNQWKYKDISDEYDHQLIKKRLRELRDLRIAGDPNRLAFHLHEGLHGNLGNMANPALYSHSYIGTKLLLTDYINEVCDALNYLCDTDFPQFNLEDKYLFFDRTAKCFGRSALLLSGGATLGMFHLGVVKALWEEGLLPTVISGSSAGSIVAGLIGTHTDDEIPNLFDPDYLHMDVWQTLGIHNLFKTGVVMDGTKLEAGIEKNLGNYSFEEAYERTGRIINIPVSPLEPHHQARLLNYLTAPHVLISRTSLASCAIPGIFPSVELYERDFDGHLTPYMPGVRWVDGSLTSDLPMLRISRFHNANHYIVSQTNPHVTAVLNEDDHKKGMLPFAKELLSTSYKVYGKHVIDLAKHHFENQGISRVLGSIQKVTNQKYHGDITIFAKHSPSTLLKAISNPSNDEIDSFIRAGERETWPKIERIRNATRISRTFEACQARLDAQATGQNGRLTMLRERLGL